MSTSTWCSRGRVGHTSSLSLPSSSNSPIYSDPINPPLPPKSPHSLLPSLPLEPTPAHTTSSHFLPQLYFSPTPLVSILVNSHGLHTSLSLHYALFIPPILSPGPIAPLFVFPSHFPLKIPAKRAICPEKPGSVSIRLHAKAELWRPILGVSKR